MHPSAAQALWRKSSKRLFLNHRRAALASIARTFDARDAVRWARKKSASRCIAKNFFPMNQRIAIRRSLRSSLSRRSSARAGAIIFAGAGGFVAHAGARESDHAKLSGTRPRRDARQARAPVFCRHFFRAPGAREACLTAHRDAQYVRFISAKIWREKNRARARRRASRRAKNAPRCARKTRF